MLWSIVPLSLLCLSGLYVNINEVCYVQFFIKPVSWMELTYKKLFIRIIRSDFKLEMALIQFLFHQNSLFYALKFRVSQVIGMR